MFRQYDCPVELCHRGAMMLHLEFDFSPLASVQQQNDLLAAFEVAVNEQPVQAFIGVVL